MKIFLRFCSTFMFLVLLTNLASAMGTTGKIAGRVTDAGTGQPLPFINVVIEGTTLGASTDMDGYYTILNVSPGVYRVKASAIGYNSVTVQNIKVSIDFTTKQDFQLAETSIQLNQEVVVTATRPLVQKDLTASTSVVGEELISELPVTDIGDVLQLQAGMVSSGGGLHLRGGRSGQIAYQIDGVPMTDAFDNSNVVDVATNSIQELQVVSGAFNAEFGQAMSGIVNIVTKDGDNKLTGNFQAYAGDYASNKTDIFWDINNFKPLSIKSVEGSLSGPILKDKLFFFLNGRYFYNDGYFYGKRTYRTTDFAQELAGSAGADYVISKSGDDSYVAMNPNERYFGQGKLTSRLTNGIKLSYNYMIDYQEYKDFNRDRLLTPDNNLQRFRKGYTNTLSLNHAVSSKSYYTLNLTYFFKDYRHYLYEDINSGNSTQYVDNNYRQTPPYSFQVGGSDYSRVKRNTGTYSAKLDWTTQLTQEVNFQVGGEFKQHQIYYQNITLYPYYEQGNLRMAIPSRFTDQYNEYQHKPQEASMYAQSKFEAFNLIFNVGLRLDVFNPDGKILNDPTDPNIVSPLKPSNQYKDLNGNGVRDDGEPAKTVADRMGYWYKDATIKYQLSPRIGLAFPITDRGVIHFSYGHFMQLPSYELLYENPEFEMGIGSGNQGLFGNADLKPQKTVKGEIGLQQQLGEDMSVDVTMFFEDFRDLTGTQTDEILVYGKGSAYSMYANSDFGFSKGFIVKFEKRFSGGLATSIDYTYSVTKGNSSNPADARNAITSGALPETYIAPLNWDQTHTLNISLAYSKPRDFGFSIIGNIYSGQPYTPAVNQYTLVTENAYPRNSANKPTTFNVDLRAYKDIPIGDMVTMSVFFKVFNLLDMDNPNNVNTDTGDPYFTFSKYAAEKIGARQYGNTLNEYYTNQGYFSEPRRVEFGISFNF